MREGRHSETCLNQIRQHANFPLHPKPVLSFVGGVSPRAGVRGLYINNKNEIKTSNSNLARVCLGRPENDKRILPVV